MQAANGEDPVFIDLAEEASVQVKDFKTVFAEEAFSSLEQLLQGVQAVMHEFDGIEQDELFALLGEDDLTLAV